MLNEGIRNVVISFWNLYNLPNREKWRVQDHFPDDVSVLLDSGGFSAAKQNKLTDFEDYIRAYFDFIEANADRLTYVLEFDGPLDLEAKEEYRSDFYEHLGFDQFLPVWHAADGTMEALAQQYDQIALPASEVGRSDEALRRVRQVSRDTRLFALNIGFPTLLRAAPFMGATTSAWLSPMRYGETHLWIQNSFRRFRAQNKDSIRRRHAGLVERAGFSSESVLADDTTEVTRFTIWVWREYEKWLQGEYQKSRGTDRVSALDLEGEEADSSLPALDESGSEAAPSPGVISPPQHLPPRAREGQKLLPVLGQNDEDTTLISQRNAALRECNTCYLAGKCDQYEAGAECAYELPVSIRTREELASALQTMMEFQFNRTTFGYFAELKEGGFPDLRVSRELERYFRMVAFFNEFTDRRDRVSLRLDATSSTPGQTGGILSQLLTKRLGAPAVAPLGALPPGSADEFLGEVMDISVKEDKKLSRSKKGKSNG